MELLFKEFNDNHEISVYETSELYGEKGKFRFIQFSNEAIQGALDLNNPERIVFEYPRAIIHLMEYNDPSFEDVFMIGHGIGTIASHFSDKRCKIAELDGTVVELSKNYFGYKMDNVSIGDGRYILNNEQRHVYDYIIVDAFTEKGTPQHLTSKQFFRMTREKLDTGGSIIMNLMGKGENDRLMNAIHTTLSEEYAYTQAFLLPTEDTQTRETRDMKNIIMVGSNKPIEFQIRHMVGFIAIEPGLGHIIMDNHS